MMLDLSMRPEGRGPVWTGLDAASVQALSGEPSRENGALQLVPDLGEGALEDSVLLRNARVLLEFAGGGDVLWMSASSGALRMKCVSMLRRRMAWPGLEATERFREGKTYREQAVKELHLLRLLVEQAGLIRPGGLWFERTPLGERMLAPERSGALQALLFREAFWGLDLSRFLPVYFPVKLPGRWPQERIGPVLWALSAVAGDWRGADALTGLCASVDDLDGDARSIRTAAMFVWRVLWPLRWFGLMEVRGPEEIVDMAWRKTGLFDRFLSFDIGVRGSGRAPWRG